MRLDQVNHDQFVRDMLADAFSSVSAIQWRERAEQFRAARPRPGDFVGESTIEERRACWRRLSEIAKACDAKATLLARVSRDTPADLEAFDLREAS